MIKRIIDEKNAITCDKLLTKLINDEIKFDKLISQNFKVQDYFKNVIKDNNKGYLIDDLYIEKAYRRKGYARKLLEYALKLLGKHTSNFIDINVLCANETARNL